MQKLAALSRRADGIILTGEVTDAATRARLRQREHTVIETWGIPDDPIDVAVGFSHRAVGRDIARFLRSRGYSRPLLTSANTARARQRRDGFLEEWKAAGGGAPEIFDVPAPTRLGHARPVWDRIMRCDEMPDVVVCGSDLLAQGVIIEAQSAGFRVPDQVAVMGFGNVTLARDMRPPITQQVPQVN